MRRSTHTGAFDEVNFDTSFGAIFPGCECRIDQRHAGLSEIGLYGSERGSAEFAGSKSVESDHADLIGHCDPERGQFLQRTERHGIAGEKQSVEARAAIDAAIAR